MSYLRTGNVLGLLPNQPSITDWRWLDRDRVSQGPSFCTDDYYFSGYAGLKGYDTEWPRSRDSLNPDPGTDGRLLSGTWYGRYNRWRGVTQRWAITGVTRDQFGTPLASCTVRCFTAADSVTPPITAHTLVDTVVSDANGNFTLYTPITAGNYLVAYKVGTPDVEGTTVNTLTGI